MTPPKSLIIQTWVDIIFKLLIGVGMIFLASGYLEQRDERICLFELSTETDKVDSDIAAKQGQIFEAAILRPSPNGGATREMQQLGEELRLLIVDRDEAYARRTQAAGRC